MQAELEISSKHIMNTIEEDIAKIKELLDEYENIVQYQPSELEDWINRGKESLLSLDKNIKRAQKLRMSLGLLCQAEQVQAKLKELLNSDKITTFINKIQQSQPLSFGDIKQDKLASKIKERLLHLQNIPVSEFPKTVLLTVWKFKTMVDEEEDVSCRSIIREGINDCCSICRERCPEFEKSLLDTISHKSIAQSSSKKYIASYEPARGTYAVANVSLDYQREIRTADGVTLHFFGNGDIYMY